MRALTLDEKISIKGIFEFKGVILPKLNMTQALFFLEYMLLWNNS